MDITSLRLILKEVSGDDLEAIHMLHSIPEVDRYNTLGIPENIEETKEVLLPVLEDQQSGNRKRYQWKIVERDSGEFIGIAGMSLSADRFKLGEIWHDRGRAEEEDTPDTWRVER